jgi:hypothetical protein
MFLDFLSLVCGISGNHAENDPFNMSETAMSMGYSFGIKKPSPVVKAPTPRKKASSSKEKAAAATASTASKKNMPHGSASVISSHFASTATAATVIATNPASAPAKPERKRRAPAQSSRPAQKRKPDPKQAYDASAQARNFIPQQSSDPNLHAARGNFSRRPSTNPMDQQAPQYNQFMKPMPPQNPNSPAQQRATFQQQLLQQQQQQQQPQQFSSPQQRQMAQLRMMQQPPQPGPQVPYGQGPSSMQQPAQPGQQVSYGQGLQQMQQFFAPLPPQQFQQQPMAMPSRAVGPPGHAPMNMQGSMPGNMQGNNMVRRGPQGDEQSDPLFMLKDM